jgi:predicted nucleic acid-binding protein
LRSVDSSALHISAVSAGEIQTGIEITRRQNPDRARELESWLDEILESFSFLPMDSQTFRVWARLKIGRASTLYDDAIIAATAIIHDLTVVTRNVRDFESFGIPTLDPFSTRD